MYNVWDSDWHAEWNIERRGNWKLKFKLNLWFAGFIDICVLLSRRKPFVTSKYKMNTAKNNWKVDGRLE